MIEPGFLITIGCPGAGKSTWAAQNLDQRTLRLERDRYRECIFGSRRAYHASPIGKDARSTLITQAMLQSMIYWPWREYALTDTGLFWHSVAPFVHHAQRTETPIRLVVFEVPDDTLRQRNVTRQEEHRIPEDLLEDMIAEFRREDAWWRSAPFEVTRAESGVV